MATEFSVVIPTFRRPAQLHQALASVLSQRGVELEVFVVDDSPEGSARDVVAAFGDARVRYILNPKPTGGIPARVRNLALSEATGAFIHFLDDDDIVPADRYRTARQAFADHPDVGMIFGPIEPFGDCPPEQLDRERRYFQDVARRAAACQRLGKRLGFAAEMLFGRILLVCSAALYRRECALALGGFDTGIRLMEDGEFNLRMMRRFGARFIDRTALRYRIGSPSLMHDPNPSAKQIAEVREGRRRTRDKYRADRGAVEFYALAVWQRASQIRAAVEDYATRKRPEQLEWLDWRPR
jgi:glycosyltransferase involved in cell wall biosynthesis